MGNEFSASPDGTVDAVLQFNDVRGAASAGPFTALVTVDNGAEMTLKKNGEPLQCRLTAKSVISMKVVSGTVLGTCYIPISRIQERNLGMVLYHIWLLLENVPCRGYDDIAERFEHSLYNIAKSIYQPKICITLASSHEYGQMQNGGIYPLIGVPAADSAKVDRYYSILHSHFQHLQLCQSYYIGLQQKEQQLKSMVAGEGGRNSRPPSLGGPEFERKSLIFGDMGEFNTTGQSTRLSDPTSDDQVRRLADRCEALEQQVSISRKQTEDAQARNAANIEQVLTDSRQTQVRLQNEIERLKTELANSSKSTGLTSDSKPGLSSQADQQEIVRLNEEIKGITDDANARIDKANDTIRLLRNQNKDLQRDLQAKNEELHSVNSQRTSFENSDKLILRLREELEQEREKKQELMNVVQSLYTNLNPVSDGAAAGDMIMPSPRTLEQTVTSGGGRS